MYITITKAGGGMHQRIMMKKSNLISFLRECPGTQTQTNRKPPPCAPFTCPAACSQDLIHWERGGDTLVSCPNNFGTFPLLLEKAIYCLIW